MTYEEQLLQNLAAESDPRTTAVDYRWWDAVKGYEARLEDGYTESGTWLRIRFEVCALCRGRGRHVNPSIDAHGLSREDFDEDDGFRDDYFAGNYDIPCNLCEGEKVVPVPLDPEWLKAIREHADALSEMRAEQLAEMRMGA